MLSISLLGPIELRLAGTVAPLSANDRALLAALSLRIGQPVSIASLTNFVWNDRPPAKATQSIQTYVRRLRQHLGGQITFCDDRGYALEGDPEIVDVVRFNRLFEAACGLRRSDLGRCLDNASGALELWRGPAMSGVESFQAAHARNVLEETRLSTVEILLRCRMDRGEDGAVAAELRQLVILHPRRPSFWALLMAALYRGGRQSDALRVGQQAAAQLRLGPNHGVIDLRNIETAILTQDPGLEESLLDSAHAAAL
ncbi:MAG: hypothetical protein GY929_00490 [Actinomycetia bacterium]|nr:hypothetical protein [Actinomycetes bacterium]